MKKTIWGHFGKNLANLGKNEISWKNKGSVSF